ncbi:nitrogen fixation protein NifW [Chromatium weissei]|nr:nitrogen fixation protein NifW [Chromatium weissei]
MMNDDFESDLAELASAEEFLDYFGIAFDAAVVQVNRLHILQRFHDYLKQVTEMPTAPTAQRALYADRLHQAYQDFLTSDAATEKVFRVFHMNQPRSVAVPLSTLMQQVSHASAI